MWPAALNEFDTPVLHILHTTYFLQFCAYLYELSSLAAHIWLGPGMISDRGNTNQLQVNLLLHRQFSLNCCKTFLLKTPNWYLPKKLVIAFL